jgi:hypothetical protein
MPHPATLDSDDSVLDDILTPMERNVKAYLVAAVSKDLLELLALMAVERPDDPHLWLGSKLLERSPNGPFLATKRSAYAVRGRAAGQEEAGGSSGSGGGGGGGRGGEAGSRGGEVGSLSRGGGGTGSSAGGGRGEGGSSNSGGGAAAAEAEDVGSQPGRQ